MLVYLQSGQSMSRQLVSAPHAASWGGWTRGSSSVHSWDWHVGAEHPARVTGSECRFLSTWAPRPHQLLWLPLCTVAVFQEQASQETGSENCQCLKTWAQRLAQHLIYRIHLSNSRKARFKGKGDVPPLKGRRIKESGDHVLKLPQRRTDKVNSWVPLGLAVSNIMALMKMDGMRSLWGEQHHTTSQACSGLGKASPVSLFGPLPQPPWHGSLQPLGSPTSTRSVPIDSEQPPIPDSPQGLCEHAEHAVTPQSRF